MSAHPIVRVLAGIVAGAVLALATPAHAQSAPTGPAAVMPGVPAKVQVRVQVIRARTGAPHVDPQLAPIAAALARMPFQDFRWVRESTFRLADGEQEGLDLGSGRRLVIGLQRHDAVAARVEARYERPGARPAVTTLTVNRDRAFFYSLKGDTPGEAILLELDVRY